MSLTPLAIPLLRAAAWFEEGPSGAGLAAGSDGFLDVAWGAPDVAFVEPLVRRRLSRLARGCFHCARRLAPPAEVRVVFASQHGEAERTLGILQELAAGSEISPAHFSMSVHNAVPGLWSILTGDHAGASAVAAGPETFALGLVEALAALAAEPALPVLYLYGDDRLPELWAQGVPQPGPHAVALLLGTPPERILELGRDPEAPAAEMKEPQAYHALRALRGLPGSPWTGPGAGWDFTLKA